MTNILLTQPVPDAIDRELLRRYSVHRLYEAADPDAFLACHGQSIQAVVTGGAKGLPNPIMDRLPALRLIAISGIGTDAVDLAHAASRGVQVSTTPGVLTDDVADMAIGLLIMTLRELGTGERIVRAGAWGKTSQPLARKVTGISLGIVGLGRVGHAIAHRAQAFGMTIRYHDHKQQPESGHEYVGDIETLARCSDVLVLAASADNGEAIITAKVLQALGPQGYLVNVARGKLVDEQALVAALSDRVIAGAGLDVFADEPNVPQALRELDNVVLQPHRGSATLQTRLAMGEMVLASLQACFDGQPAAMDGL